MDNFHIDVTSEGNEPLKLALKLACGSYRQATHWANHPQRGLVLFWSKPEDGITFVDAKQRDYLPHKGKPGDLVYVAKETDYCGKTHRWVVGPKKSFEPDAGQWEEVEDPPTKPLEVHPFPFKMKKSEDLAPFVIGWLEDADYGHEPDHDGSNGKGWRVYTHNWGRVNGCGSYAFVAIEPAWAMYGK